MDNQPPKIGQPEQLQHGVRRILAPNASPMTYWGTNTYLVGQDAVAVIDPGPNDPAHLAAIQQAAPNITHIIVTHAHVDHTAGVAALAQAAGAPVYAFGPADRGQSDLMRALVAQGLTSGGEGVDRDFAPDVQLEDGQVIEGPDWQLQVIWTPGHIGNHISLRYGDAVLTGDHVMGWATSIVSPPDGDMGAFLASCDRLLAHSGDRVYYPGHGDPVTDPHDRVRWLIAHRKEREAQILSELRAGPMMPHQLVEIIYADIPKALFPAAERNVFAHLIDLHEREIVAVKGPVKVNQKFERTD